MYSVVVAFGLASVMLCIGMAIRAKVKFFQHMLMPVSVIGAHCNVRAACWWYKGRHRG